MEEILRETRIYPYQENGKHLQMKVDYKIVKKDGIVQDVFNEYNHTVNKNSEVFEFYSNKFNS
jgi:hypothetical protein